MYYLYILECFDRTLYTGITTDLGRRLSEHNSKKIGAKYTLARRPVKLVFSRAFKTRSTASKAEAQIKKLNKAKKTDLIKKFRPNVLPKTRTKLKHYSRHNFKRAIK